MSRVIKHHYFFPHAPEKVWEYLTKPELIEQWLMKNDFQPVIGHTFQFTTGPIPSIDFDGIFHCKVLEIVPNKKLSYSWNCGPGDGKITLESVVIWYLQPVENGTDLLLEHSGFGREENLELYHGLMNGWPGKFIKISNMINAL